MIRNIFNWVGGGFFRTIGRFVAFIVLGAIVSYFISKSNLNLPNLFGFEYVKADTYVQGVDTPWYKSDLTTPLSRQGTFDYQTATTSYPNAPITTSDFYVQTPFDISNIRTGYWTVPFYIDAPAVSIANTNNGNLNLTHYLCARWIESSSGTYQCNLWSDPSTSQTFSFTDSEFIMPQSDVQAIAVYQNGYTDICTVDSQNNVIKCPVASYTSLTGIARVQIKSRVYYSSGTYQTTYYVGLGRKVNKYSNDTTSIINNQNQIANQTITTITDANITETNSTATSFFENFSDNDHGGLSSIITAPLTTIQSMLSNTCVAPSATWEGATITLPCGDFFWSRPGAEGLRNLVNVFYGGFVCYYAIRRLFLLIENLKDPTYDKIEVVDL